MNDDIKKMIERYEEAGDFTHATVTDSIIQEAENLLGVKIPDQFVSFLKLYGHGGIGGICTNGVGIDGSLVFVDDTIESRNEGLPQKYIVIENCDEWLYCIDTETDEIVSWDQSGHIKQEYDCFDSYLIDQMREAIDNL